MGDAFGVAAVVTFGTVVSLCIVYRREVVVWWWYGGFRIGNEVKPHTPARRKRQRKNRHRDR